MKKLMKKINRTKNRNQNKNNRTNTDDNMTAPEHRFADQSSLNGENSDLLTFF